MSTCNIRELSLIGEPSEESIIRPYQEQQANSYSEAPSHVRDGLKLRWSLGTELKA
jgi:hypothetical protein